MIRPNFLRFIAIAIFTWFGIPSLNAQGATSGGTAVPMIRSFGDIRSVNVADELASVRESSRALLGSVPVQPLTFAAAQAKVNALANSAGGNAAVAAVLAALAPADPERLRAVAAREMIEGRPTGMFLVLWTVWKRYPADGDAWCDFAGALAGLGYANEATAFLSEMKRLGLLPRPPLDIPGEEMRDYVEAYTQVRLGNSGGALAILRRIAGRTPMLAEAPRLLAAITDDETEARKALLQSIWRKSTKVMVSSIIPEGEAEPDPDQAGEEVMADPRDIMDFSQAERGVLPAVPYAKSVTKANALAEKLVALRVTLDQEFAAVLAARKMPRGFEHPDGYVQEVWGHYLNGLMKSLDYRDQHLRELARKKRDAWIEREKEFKRLNQARSDEVDPALHAYALKRVKSNGPPLTLEEIGAFMRPYYEKYLAIARPVCVREELAQREFFAEWHYLATAVIAAAPKGPWHEAMQATLNAQKIQAYGSLVHIAHMHAEFSRHPYITNEPEEKSGTVPGRTQAGNCDPDKSVGFSTSELPGGKALPFELGFEMNCEGASVEFGVDTRIPA